MSRILREANPNTQTAYVAILTYRTAANTTIVLDGNHRLAALLRQPKERREQSLIVFQLREVPEDQTPEPRVKTVTPSMRLSKDQLDHAWVSFNPDLCRVKDPDALPEQLP